MTMKFLKTGHNIIIARKETSILFSQLFVTHQAFKLNNFLLIRNPIPDLRPGVHKTVQVTSMTEWYHMIPFIHTDRICTLQCGHRLLLSQLFLSFLD